MNLIETTIVGSVAAIVGGAVAWFTKGRVESDSLQVRQAQAVLAMWQATSESQNKELTQLRNEVVSLRQRLEEMEHTIHELQSENAKLKSSANILEPTIVQINIPHQVKNYSNKTRVVLAVRFTPDIGIK